MSLQKGPDLALRISNVPFQVTLISAVAAAAEQEGPHSLQHELPGNCLSSASIVWVGLVRSAGVDLEFCELIKVVSRYQKRE